MSHLALLALAFLSAPALYLFFSVLEKYLLLLDFPSTSRIYVERVENYTAIVVIDRSVVQMNNDYYVVGGSEKISGQELARSCARAMKAVAETMRSSGIEIKDKRFSSRGNTCIFKFLGRKTFEAEATKVNFKEPKLINAYAHKLISNNKYPETVFRSDFIATIVEKGDLAIHELIHVFGWAYYDYWDITHVFWKDEYYFIEGRNFNKIGRERWNVLNNKHVV